MTSGSHGLTYDATDESKSAPKFEVESYFVHHTLANKIALNLEFWSTFDYSYEPRKVEKVQKSNFLQESEGCGRKCSPKFEVESYFVRNSVMNKVTLNLEFWSNPNHGSERCVNRTIRII